MQTWLQIIHHIGKNLPDGHLMSWMRDFILRPHVRLPYLFLVGPNMSGKTLFIEAISMFAIPVRVSTFNAEMEGKNLAIIDEVRNEAAKERIRRMYAAEHIIINEKLRVANTFRWVQEANKVTDFPGISNHLFAQVDKLKFPLRAGYLMDKLRSEADEFIRYLEG